MANIPALKAELLNVLTVTTNLTATEKTKLRNRFVTAYPTLWQEYLAGGGTDTAANRAAFAIDRTFDFWTQIYRSGSQKENIAALPQPEVIG
jgi:hypothetical protein